MTALELKLKYDVDLKKIQDECKHFHLIWCAEEWRDGKYTNLDILCCKYCWRIFQDRPSIILPKATEFVRIQNRKLLINDNNPVESTNPTEPIYGDG
jgi:hypothetical protein